MPKPPTLVVINVLSADISYILHYNSLKYIYS